MSAIRSVQVNCVLGVLGVLGVLDMIRRPSVQRASLGVSNGSGRTPFSAQRASIDADKFEEMSSRLKSYRDEFDMGIQTMESLTQMARTRETSSTHMEIKILAQHQRRFVREVTNQWKRMIAELIKEAVVLSEICDYSFPIVKETTESQAPNLSTVVDPPFEDPPSTPDRCCVIL